jgi:hypothetical protein
MEIILRKHKELINCQKNGKFTTFPIQKSRKGKVQKTLRVVTSDFVSFTCKKKVYKENLLHDKTQ